MRTLLVVALVGCSSGHPAPLHPGPHAEAHVDAAPAAPVAAAPLTAAECHQLIDHAASFGWGTLTDDERAQLRQNLHAGLDEPCLKLPRAAYTCAMAASTSSQLAGCDQATRSSSTSNSSVAPGGITPAAPRSP